MMINGRSSLAKGKIVICSQFQFSTLPHGAKLEALDLHQGHRVLEIGAGTGYYAALMGHLVGM